MFIDIKGGRYQWGTNPYTSLHLLRNAKALYHNEKLKGTEKSFKEVFDEYLRQININPSGYEWPEEFDNFEGFPTHT
jgi:hypothetical protein